MTLDNIVETTMENHYNASFLLSGCLLVLQRLSQVSLVYTKVELSTNVLQTYLENVISFHSTRKVILCCFPEMLMFFFLAHCINISYWQNMLMFAILLKFNYTKIGKTSNDNIAGRIQPWWLGGRAVV